MNIKQIKKLHHGDEVFWNDPDNGECSRYYTIGTIVIDILDDQADAVVCITDKDGTYLECFPHELK